MERPRPRSNAPARVFLELWWPRVRAASEEEHGRWLAQLLRADHVEDALR